MNRDNIPYEKAVSILQKMTDIGTVYFTIGSLDYIKKGGRLGKLASMVTGILNIRPSLFLKNGEVNVSGLCRTRKKSVANVFESCKNISQAETLTRILTIFRLHRQLLRTNVTSSAVRLKKISKSNVSRAVNVLTYV